MTHDQDLVRRLQLRFPKWDPAKDCRHFSHKQCCVYNKQGRLIELHLCCLLFTQIPPEVWQCSSLRKLYLSFNQLSTLPAEMGQLASLQVLDLSDNQFSTLPAVVCQLTALRKLYLNGNQL